MSEIIQENIQEKENNTEVAVEFKNVTKIYKLFKSNKARLRRVFNKRVPYKEKKAVDKLTFTVHRGESVAFLGRNGAGKSTLLKMVTGVTFPTEGEVIVNGKVSALLELGAGFDLEASGKENIHLKCSLMGMTDDEIKLVEDDIIDFADIDEYIDQPVRSYSSGMKARLGFAINVNVKPDILIVDEALSVGDKEFRKKCTNKVNAIMADKNVTLLFVTHSLSMARDFCQRGIVMEKGKKTFDGNIEEAIKYYDSK